MLRKLECCGAIWERSLKKCLVDNIICENMTFKKNSTNSIPVQNQNIRIRKLSQKSFEYQTQTEHPVLIEHHKTPTKSYFRTPAYT